MRILYDLLPQQDYNINGGSLYGLAILEKLIENNSDKNYKIFGVYNSKKPLNEQARAICEKHSIELFDLSKEKIEVICDKNKIDKFFIAISQRYRTISLEKVTCKIVIVCHDISNLIMSDSGIYSSKKLVDYYCDITGKKFSIKGLVFKYIQTRYNYYKYYKTFISLIAKKNVQVVTVSNYSKNSLDYYFGDFANEIKVFWSAAKTYSFSEEIKTNKIKEIVDSGKKYFLLISCERFNKNARVFHKQFSRLNKKLGGDYYAVLLGKTKIKGENIIVLNETGGSDLEHLYKNAQAFVYLSLAEGFGYPPVEAMRYGTPVVASFCTSIPEVLENDAIYFNAMYPEDLYSKLQVVVENRNEYSNKAQEAFDRIEQKQKEDLKNLVQLITE